MQGIYKITNPKGKIYIGQSVNIEKRFSSYKSIRNCHYQIKLFNSLKKYGSDNHIFQILEECKDEDLNVRERYYQDYYDVLGKNGLNCRLTTTNDKTGRHSLESRMRMSIAQKGMKKGSRPDVAERNKLIHRGKVMSEEARQKISLATKGIKSVSEETRKKIANSHKGKPKGEDAKKRMSEAARKRKKVECIHCKKQFDPVNARRWHFDNCKQKPI